jgi:hypothetical protein
MTNYNLIKLLALFRLVLDTIVYSKHYLLSSV